MEQLRKKNIYREVIESPEFERLNDISFLGILGYWRQNGNKVTTRFDHSLSVADLCLRYSKKKSLLEVDEIYIVLAGLLHDLGHCSFSHSLEPVFKKKWNITHHTMTRNLIATSPNLLDIWNKYSINPSRIIDTIEGYSNRRDNFVTKMCFNFDTLDGMVRTENQFRDSTTLRKVTNQIFNVLCDKENWKTYRDVFDLFWKEKERIYNTYIYDEKPKHIELFFQYLFMNDSTLSIDHFELTDSQMQTRHPWIESFIEELKNSYSYEFIFNNKMGNSYAKDKVKAKTRKFIISSNGDFSSTNNNRYLVSKHHDKSNKLDNYVLPLFQ